ncbi:hypothetical protein NESM_000910300 [Novymonas esmeraldas]|uniref:Uncharacterized protein n=1 Tax=Novymonas esmeraldas TaxID=1808958 RepID=A0AAW0F2C4_9TRYP
MTAPTKEGQKPVGLTAQDAPVDISCFLGKPSTADAALAYKCLYRQGGLTREAYMAKLSALADTLAALPVEGPLLVGDFERATRSRPRMPEAHRSLSDPATRLLNELLSKEESLNRRIANGTALDGCVRELEAAVNAHRLSAMVAASATILLGLDSPEGTRESAETRIARWFEYMVREPESTRLYRYNARIVQSMGPDALPYWKDALMTLQVPLVANTPALQHVNLLLQEEAMEAANAIASGVVMGGQGSVTPMHDKLYRHPRRGPGML